MIDTKLDHRVLFDNHLHKHRLVASVSTIELHKLVIGISTGPLSDILLTIVGDRMMAESHKNGIWHSETIGAGLYFRSFAKHKFALKDLRLLVTQGFLNGIFLKIRKFGLEGANELVHFFVSNDERIAADNIINELSVLFPPNTYHKNPVTSWTRVNPQPGFRMPQLDGSLFSKADSHSSRRQVIVPLEVFRNIPKGDNILVNCNGDDLWSFRNSNDKGSLIEIRRKDWFRALYKRNVNTMDQTNSGDSFDAENLPGLSERALTVLADRAVHRPSRIDTLS